MITLDSWIGGGSDGWKISSAPSPGSEYNSFNRPTGVYVDSSGYIYISDSENERICKWDASGTALGWIGGGSNGWKTDSGASYSTGYQFFGGPRGLFVDTYGNIYIAEAYNDRISKWDASGTALGWIGGGYNGWYITPGTSSTFSYKGFYNPFDVFVDTANNIFIADSESDRISKWHEY
ncbi:MAG: NHL repeat-containing protein [Acidobacteria bacterium]|nr:NHL repeat-containing protein [Acidobacteriota bacterium]